MMNIIKEEQQTAKYNRTVQLVYRNELERRREKLYNGGCEVWGTWGILVEENKLSGDSHGIGTMYT